MADWSRNDAPASVIHCFDPELSQFGHALAQGLDHRRLRSLPAPGLLEHPQGLGRSVRPGRVAREALVGDVRVVCDRAEWLDPVDPAGPFAGSELGRQGAAGRGSSGRSRSKRMSVGSAHAKPYPATARSSSIVNAKSPERLCI